MAWHDRLWNAARPERLSRELDREMDFHLSERVDELIAGGMAPEKARREAARRFGNRTSLKERTRDVDVLVWLESLVADVRYAVRGLIRSPGFAAVAIVSLALGIGANTAIFSLTNALLLKALPVRAPAELLQVTIGEDGPSFTNPQWEEIRGRQRVFSSVFAYTDRRFNLSTGGEARRVPGALVSGAFFATLGITPAAGRLLQPSDDVRGCPAVAVVSDGFARRSYGGEAEAVGRAVSLEGHPFQIAGVSSAGFFGVKVGTSVDIYAPLCALEILSGPGILDERGRWFLEIVGRLKPGVSPAQAGAAVQAMAAGVFEATLPSAWSEEHQREYLANQLSVKEAGTGLSELRGRYGRALVTLLIVVGVVLLIACANIANLLLARAATREHESAIRRAIGASRGRIVRQLMTESLLLAVTGAAAGVLFSRWASRLLVSFLSTGRRQVWLDLSIDGRVLAFTAGVAVATGVLFGLVPAWRSGRVSPQATMRGGGRGILGRKGRRRAGRALVVGQVALSLALVAGAGLLVGTFRTLSTLDPGFSREGVLVVQADLRSAGLGGERADVTRDELLRRLRALSGVASVSASFNTPVSNSMWNQRIEAAGYTPRSERDDYAYFNQVTDGYFATMGTPLLAGRDIAPLDGRGSARVAVVTEAMARRFFGSTDPVGRTFRTGGAEHWSDPIEVVGVVGDAKYNSLTEEPPPTAFIPFGQVEDGPPDLALEVRGFGTPAALVPGVKAAVAEVSPAITLDITTLADQLSSSLARPRLLATLSGFFGGLALLLAVIGLYGTMAYGVTRRRGEIGIRMALGAVRHRVVRMVVGEAGRLVLAGIALGVALSLAGTRVLASFLYGVEADDPLTLAGAAALLLAVALGAALLPAWRASRVQPMETLRDDG